MTERRACPAAPGPLEEYAAQFDSLFGTLAQPRGFRDYLQGLLLPRDRNKTLTALAMGQTTCSVWWSPRPTHTRCQRSAPGTSQRICPAQARVAWRPRCMRRPTWPR
jgi:hypothetical protein